MEKLRLYIRKVLLESFFNEASIESTGHYNHNYINRILKSVPQSQSFESDDKGVSSFAIKKIEEVLNVIQHINFPENESYAIKLVNLGREFKSLDLDNKGEKQIDKKTGKLKVSKGNSVWVLIRDNEIKTIFLRKLEQQDIIPDVQYYIKNPMQLEQFYDSTVKDKNNDIAFSYQNFIQFINNSDKKQYPIIEINGEKWFIDEENKKLFQKTKKGKITKEIENYEDNLPDDIVMKIWHVLEDEVIAEFYFK